MNLDNTLQLVRLARDMIREHSIYDSIEVDGEMLLGGDLARDLDTLCWTLEKERNRLRDEAAKLVRA